MSAASAGFLYVDMQNAVSSGHGRELLPLMTWLDARIPFLPEFIFGYVLYYPWVLLPLLVVKSRGALHRALGAFTLSQVVAETVFIFFPSHIVRPQVVGEGLAAALVRLVYRLDQGWNLFPSLHVGHTLIAALFVTKDARPAVATIVWVGTLVIWISTVLVKQHFVLDIPAGALLGWSCYALACRPLPHIGSTVWQGVIKRSE